MFATLSWSVLIDLRRENPRLADGDFFSCRPSKGRIRDVSPVAAETLVPLALEPNVRFFSKLRSHVAGSNEITRTNAKFPWLAKIHVGQRSEETRVWCTLRVYSDGILAVSMWTDRISVVGVEASARDLIDLQLLNHQPAIEQLVASVLAVVREGSTPLKRRMYPLLCLYSNDPKLGDLGSSNVFAASLVTRHQEITEEISKLVLEKNRNHNFNNQTLLIDKQGAVYLARENDIDDVQAKSRLSKMATMFEYASVLKVIVDGLRGARVANTYEEFLLYRIHGIVNVPEMAIPNSTSGAKAWKLLMDELALPTSVSELAKANQLDFARYGVMYERLALRVKTRNYPPSAFALELRASKSAFLVGNAVKDRVVQAATGGVIVVGSLLSESVRSFLKSIFL